MPRVQICSAVLMLALPLFATQRVHAQAADGDVVFPPQGAPVQSEQVWQRQVQAYRNGQGYVAAQPAAQTRVPAQETGKHRYVTGPALVGGGVVAGDISGAPLYPCPRPNIPTEVGATMITNPALAPHEMLYPHKYRALYAPFYYKTTRCWCLMPGKLHMHEKRVLTGTEVSVQYKGHISPFALFHAPVPLFHH